ncbi:hypothetical protein ACT91Q_06160 [Brevibacillus thermoruber]|uniref:Uncharacterized protein n=1 Tax=Brevibacillus aydinogluensis TaxID=927786 RepID=A0AA48M6Z9_9BACL|nr:hypothetical protein [Brevibacillus aydinogluensis]CAJ1000781.1 hypothetical protein BSPP4475_00395 [Brevibacillus aydinogluensis]
MKFKKSAVYFGIVATVIMGGIFSITSNMSVIAHGDEHHSLFTNDVLGTSNRDVVTICVENKTSEKSNGISTEKLSKKIEKQLEKIESDDKRFKAAGYSDVQIEVKEGCSFDPFLLEDDVVHPIYAAGDQARVVETPSTENLGIFVVDEEIIEKNFKGAYSRWSPEEFACEGHECNEVTKGLYFSPKEAKEFIKDLSKDPTLYKELLHGLSLEPVAPPVDEEQQEKDRKKKEQDVIEIKEKRKN